MASRERRSKERPTRTQARAARRARKKTRKNFIKFGAFGAVLIIALVFIFSLFAGSITPFVGGSSSGSGSIGERFSDQGRDHIALGAEHAPYNSIPATSGWHYDFPHAPAAWGIYDEPLPDEVLVHNLEHGGIGIHYYCPDGCDALIAQLAAIVNRGSEVLLSPYPDLDTTIALTAWNFIDKFNAFDEARIQTFIDDHMNSRRAPEAPAR